MYLKMISKKEKMNAFRKNAEAQKAKKKQDRAVKMNAGSTMVATGKGKKPMSIIKQAAKKRK